MPSGEVRATIIRKLELASLTTMPWRRTSSGRRGSTLLSRFCTSTCARSMSVPLSKVTVIVAAPFAAEDELM
jgi:hypothetical protein